MSHARKQFLAALVLIGLMVWPLIHRGLVHHYDISPWRFGGFAMYCVPRRQVNVTLHERDGTLVPQKEDSEAHRIFWKYGVGWLTWGPHDPDTSVWQQLEQTGTSLADRYILVREYRLQRESSRIVQTTYGYRPPAE